MLANVVLGNPFHPVDLDVHGVPVRKGIRDPVYRLLVHLHTVDRQSRSGVQLLVTDVALEVLRLLVLNQDLLVVELAVAVPEDAA